jgi:hypothetical protein
VKNPVLSLLASVAYVALLGLFFAQVEIQIEGGAGWAASLPTWRIEEHWLLDLLWGGRPLTGYHAWIFSFMALVFHLPAVLLATWSWRLELRILGSLALFWILEDALWFVMNPAFGLAAFVPENVPWHVHWIGPLPTDYWTFGGVGLGLLAGSHLRREPVRSEPAR